MKFLGLRDREPVQAKNKALASRIAQRKSLKMFIIILSVLLAVTLSLGGAAYIIGGALFGNLDHQEMETNQKDLTRLREILEEFGEYSGTEFTDAEVREVKYGIILERSYELSEYKDYKPLLDALKSNSALTELEGYDENEIAVCRLSIKFGMESIIRDREIQLTVPPVTETTPPVTEPPETLPSDSETNTGTESETDPPVTDPPETSIVVSRPETEPPIVSGVTVTDSDVYNVLLIGVDQAASLTDTIIVVSINKASKKVVITSFLRDLKIYDPNYGWCRINSVYVRKLNATASKGAAAGALANALNHNFGITIHNYAIVNFDIFIKVVDILGGVDVPLYYSEYIYMNAHTTGDDHMSGLRPYYEGGNETGYVYVHLNARQALMYARMRSNVYNPYTGTYDRSDDRFRNERQRNVIHGLMRKVRELDLDKIQAIAQQVLPLVTTDLDYNMFLSRLMTYLDYKRYSITSFAIPVRFSWEYGGNGYVEIFDFDRNKREWRAYVYS